MAASAAMEAASIAVEAASIAEAAKCKAVAAIGIDIDGRRGVVDLDVAGRLAFGSCAVRGEDCSVRVGVADAVGAAAMATAAAPVASIAVM